MTTTSSSDRWLDAALAAIGDVAETALMLPRPALVAVRAAMPPGLSGSFIALAGEREAVQVGLAGTPEGCRALAGALLQMPPEEAASMEHAEVADAVGEVVNIAAGGVKQRLMPALGPLSLGLPIFIHGQVAATDKVETLVAEVQLAGHGLAVVVVRARKAVPS